MFTKDKINSINYIDDNNENNIKHVIFSIDYSTNLELVSKITFL